MRKAIRDLRFGYFFKIRHPASACSFFVLLPETTPMPVTLDIEDFLLKSEEIPVVDVRSPAEFQKGHIPGAINLPLFSDIERAEVGTLYVQSGREDALLRGLDIILPKTGKLLGSLRKQTPKKNLQMYCWRGGMRSLNMAWMVEANGYQVSLLQGGYKAYRRYIRSMLDEPAKVVVLGGFTGSGKTEILNALSSAGEQVIDLEKLASHKGSAFGGIGLPGQPTNEQFENDLFELWKKLDKQRFIWIEDESRMIGRVTLPDPLLRKIQEAPLMILEVPKKIRVQRLVREYAGISDRLLCEAVMKIEARRGKSRTKEALTLIRQKDYSSVADQVLSYYDETYSFSIQRRQNQPRYPYPVSRFDAQEIAAGLTKFAYKQLKNGSYLPGL